jgi:threonine/homoserine/homoserine lactone efflux protein
MPSRYLISLLTLAGAHLLAAASPGPSFLKVARTAVSSSRDHGLMAALAMAVGAGIWALAVLVGLAGLFARFDWLYRVAQVAGGVFLCWIAFQIWRHSAQALPEVQAGRTSGDHSSRGEGLRASFFSCRLSPRQSSRRSR